MKKFLILLILFPVISNAQFKNILKKSSETATGILNKNGKVDIAAGLKEALNKGNHRTSIEIDASRRFLQKRIGQNRNARRIVQS